VNALVEAAEAMQRGDYEVDLRPEGAGDDLDRLGGALVGLAGTLEHRVDELARLARITGRVNRGLAVDKALDYVFDTFRPAVPYDRIGFARVDTSDPDGAIARAEWARSDFPEIGLPIGYSAPLAGSSLEKVIQSGAPRIINDLVAYLEAKPDSDATQRIVREGVRSSLTCPLVNDGRPVGFLFFSSREPYTYDDHHVDLCRQVAGQLALVVEKGRLIDELETLRQSWDTVSRIARNGLGDAVTRAAEALDALLAGVHGPLDDAQRAALHEAAEAANKAAASVQRLLDATRG